MRVLLILLGHDLAVALKNKTLYLILGLPLFVHVSLRLIEPAPASGSPVTLALIQDQPYDSMVLEAFARATGVLAVCWFPAPGEATLRLKAREVDGILIPESSNAPRLHLTVLRLAAPETLSILQNLTAVQDTAEGQRVSWIASVQPLQTSSIQQQTLPTWMVMMILLVGFMVLPAQVAEEKEKQHLLGWLQAPVSEGAWLGSKLIYGGVLMLLSVGVLEMLGGDWPWWRGPGYLASLGAGCFCFGALGLCLGLLCRNQASARTLGVLCYLLLLMPVALSDLSPILQHVAPWVPSFQLYEPLRVLITEDGGSVLMVRAWCYLALVGLLASLVSHRLLAKRWLM